MRVPSGTFGALWIGWPWYLIGAIAVGFNGWALEMLVCPAFGVARSAHVHTRDGSTQVVTLYLARYRDQERAQRAVAGWLPGQEWEVRRFLFPTRRWGIPGS